MTHIVRAYQISKSFGHTQALQDISFNIEQAELFGLIGPDGAGKTSLFRILTTLLLPDNGEAFIHDYHIVKDYKKIRKILGYMPGRFSLYQDLSVEENLNFYATIFGTTVKENYNLIRGIYSQIEPFKKRRAGKLSGGMKQKLALSCALIHKPSVLILDEPTTGVDAVSRKEFWEMLKDLQKQGISIIVSTPYMDEAELCDRVALIQNGNILTINTPESIVHDYSHPLFSIKADNTYKAIDDLRKWEAAFSVFAFGQNIHLATLNHNISISQITTYLHKYEHTNFRVQKIQPSIEDRFMELISVQNKA